jgi:predicted tellurium resistance membrane protein TerC
MIAIISTLLMLIMLQVVLGFDNLLYISLESKKAPEEKQKMVRKIGIGIAIGLRIVLLFIIMSIIDGVKEPIFGLNLGALTDIDSHGEVHHIHSVFESHFNIHSLIVLIGGAFIIYTAIKEIWHMISLEIITDDSEKANTEKTTKNVIISIVIMNLVFSFDSILAAIGLTKNIDIYSTKMIVMSIAIVISGILMLVLADKVSNFLKKNRMYEVLGLFVLLVVGIMLVAEGGHLAHISIFTNPITPMNNTTFYFIIVILVTVDLVQSKYKKKIIALESLEEENTTND